MGLFDIFSKKQQTQVNQAQAAPGTSIRYDPNLIGKLTHDHKALVETYTQIQQAVSQNDVKGVVNNLNKFKTELQEHLLLENVKLYVYLTRQLADDEANSEIISDFRREMAKIGRVVMEFLRKYTEQPFDPSRLAEFKDELDGIGAALTARIEREEGVLYTLYLPSYR